MSTGLTTRIETDADGMAWIQGTNTKVIEVVLDRLAHGWSPEEIHFQHPHLSMAQVHAALAYYYENQERLDQQISQDLDAVDQMSREAAPSALRSKLDRLRHTR
jgi:uncharacterized protein (DUF433 family)